MECRKSGERCHAATGIQRIGAGADGGEQDIGAGQRDVLHQHDLVEHGQPAIGGGREIRNVDGAAMEDEAGEHAEHRQRPADDARLETDEHGEAGDQFEQAGEIGKRGRGRQAGARNHPRRPGGIHQLAEAGIDEHERKQDAREKEKGAIGRRHLETPVGVCGTASATKNCLASICPFLLFWKDKRLETYRSQNG